MEYIGRNKPKQKNVYKYQKTSTAITCLENGTLRFSLPSEWKDPTESFFYNAIYKDCNGNIFHKPTVYACCITGQQVSEASWVTYQYGSDEGCVKFSVNRQFLFSEIENWVNAHGNIYDVYVGTINYMPWKTMKTDFQKECFKKGTDFKIGYINTFLLKRDAYDYEHEIRLFLVPKGPISTSQQKFIDIKIDWNRCLNTTIYFSGNIKRIDIKTLKRLLIDKKIRRSTLYDKKKEPVIQLNIDNSCF